MTYLVMALAAIALVLSLTSASTPERVEGACRCGHCKWYLNKRPGCSAPAPPRSFWHIDAAWIQPMEGKETRIEFLRFRYPVIRRVNTVKIAESLPVEDFRR